MSNQEIVDAFFQAFAIKDMEGIKNVMANNATWTFLGEHKMAGVMKGRDEVIDFFDRMRNIMMKSKPSVEKIIIASQDNHLIECQHVITNREDGVNIDHDLCVLWTFENEKIISGKHFFADPQAANNFFNKVG